MGKIDKYLLVDAKVLPDVFNKVVHAKKLLAQGKAKSLTDAVKLAGISRSAFYKYKDSVFTYQLESTRQIVTLYASLLDEAGVLSSLLAELYCVGANILTINQNIPVDGVAPVSISLRTDRLTQDLESWMADVRALHGVVEIRLLNN